MKELQQRLRENPDYRKPVHFETPLAEMPEVTRYLARVGAVLRGFRHAIVYQQDGAYSKNIARIDFQKNGEVSAADEFAPSEIESLQIKGALAGLNFPNSVPFPNGYVLPPKAERNDSGDGETLTRFRNRSGETVFWEARIDRADGEKYFLPFSYWDDDVCRMCEPDGPLPLWGMEHVNHDCRVFIHEGTKAAQYCQRLIEGRTQEDREALNNHPFGGFLKSGVHVGWIGGALNPSRSDWRALRDAGVREVILVADHDAAGRSAVTTISKLAGLKAQLLQFTEDFPPNFDLGDEFPSSMYRERGGRRDYVGPQVDELLHPATYATETYAPNPKGRPVVTLRKEVLDEWVFVTEPQLFIYDRLPGRVYTKVQFNDLMRRFSDVPNVAEKLVARRRAEVGKLGYRPDKPPGLMSSELGTSYNIFRPSPIQPVEADYAPFLEFMEYLIPEEGDRRQTLRWMATLIAKPEVRMSYALILISEAQGTGKTTLASHILAPLVGLHNVSFPNERALMSEFNGWAGFKRLAIVAEIYQGHGWKAYNQLKEVITDRTITVNEKFKLPVTVDNWLHVVASSNSENALRMDQDDRRWLAPTLTEVPWPAGRFAEFYHWLEGEGLGAIAYWAQTCGDYVRRGERVACPDRVVRFQS